MYFFPPVHWCPEVNPALSAFETQLQPDNRVDLGGHPSSIMAPPSSPDPFVYEPLDPLRDCTRLLEIEPCTDTTGLDLRCQIKQVLFSDRPRYRALSYMWGDETTRFPIYLNGKWFTVAENLFRALGFLRREKFVGSFWIDAICINQDDIQEKNRQIRIMPHIYFRASAVLVWLGLYTEAEIVEESYVNETGPLLPGC